MPDPPPPPPPDTTLEDLERPMAGRAVVLTLAGTATATAVAVTGLSTELRPGRRGRGDFGG